MTPADQAELQELVHAACDQTLLPKQRERLESLLIGDLAAQRFYLQHVHLVASLRWDLGSAAEYSVLTRLKERLAESNGAPIVVSSSQSPGLENRSRRRQPYLWTALATLAAALLITLTISSWSPRSSEPPAAAILASAKDANWEGPSLVAGARLAPQTLRLAAGIVGLDFANGAAVTLEGPAELVLLASDRAFLRHGNLTAHVPPRAIGFRVDTPAMQVIDLGTSFGLAVERTGSAEVTVFEGEVEVAATDNATPAPQRLQEGSAARVSVGQTTIEPAPFDAKRFERAWPVNFGVLQSSGVVRFIPPGPLVKPRKHEDNEHLVVFPERQHVVLDRDVTVAADRPGQYAGPFDQQHATIPSGTAVRSYLLQFNPVGNSQEPVHRLTGSITFARPIVGLVASNEQLAATDGSCGAVGSRPTQRARGIEAGDSFTLSLDRHTLTVDWTAAGGTDQLRVLVEADNQE